MASFTQTISLEGAEDVANKLKALGSTGEKALGGIQQAANAVKLQNVSGNLDKVKQSATSMANGLQEVIGSIGSFGGALTLLAGRAGPLGLAIAGVSTALFALSRNAVDSITATARTAESLGLTIAQYKGLSKAAREAGVDQETLTSALRRFSNFASEGAKEQFKATAELAKLLPSTQDFFPFIDVPRALQQTEQLRDGIARVAQVIQQQLADIGKNVSLGQIQSEIQRLIQGTNEAARSAREFLRQTGAQVPGLSGFEKLDQLVRKNAGDFESLGVSLLDSRGKAISTAEAIGRFADAIARLPEGFEKTALVQKIFGREASSLIPLLNRGAAGAKEFISAFEKLAPEFEKQRQAAFNASIAFGQMDASFSRFKNSLGVGIAPGVVDFFDRLGQAVDALKQKTNDPDILGNLLRGVSNGGANITREFNSIVQAWEQVKQFLASPLQLGAFDLGRNTIREFDSIIQAWERVKQALSIAPTPPAFNFASNTQREFNTIVAQAQAAWEAIKRIFSQALPSPGSGGGGLSDMGAGGGGGSGFDRGGFTGNIDRRRIAGVVHGREYVQPAHVVARPGVLAFMEVLRRTGDLSETIVRFARGFDMGGFVDGLNRSIAVPQFAAGGLVPSAVAAVGAGGQTINVDLRTNHGNFRLMASGEVARAMAAAARDSADAQTGTRPSWYRGR